MPTASPAAGGRDLQLATEDALKEFVTELEELLEEQSEEPEEVKLC